MTKEELRIKIVDGGSRNRSHALLSLEDGECLRKLGVKDKELVEELYADIQAETEKEFASQLLDILADGFYRVDKAYGKIYEYSPADHGYVYCGPYFDDAQAISFIDEQ